MGVARFVVRRTYIIVDILVTEVVCTTVCSSRILIVHVHGIQHIIIMVVLTAVAHDLFTGTVDRYLPTYLPICLSVPSTTTGSLEERQRPAGKYFFYQ